LLDVRKTVDDAWGSSGADWAIALELEPGPAYALNDRNALAMLVQHLTGEADYVELLPHIGVNLDIAHMKIAGVEANDLEEFKDWIVHAHIADHPGMHTVDQVVGTWSPVERSEGRDYPYLRLLSRINPDSPDRCGLPFTRTIALELEGCSRIGWIHRSLVAMKHMTEVVKLR
jgi:hypothetical protein